MADDLDRAKSLLHDLLMEGLPVPVVHIRHLAQRQHIPWHRVEQARRDLQVTSIHNYDVGRRCWQK